MPGFSLKMNMSNGMRGEWNWFSLWSVWWAENYRSQNLFQKRFYNPLKGKEFLIKILKTF